MKALKFVYLSTIIVVSSFISSCSSNKEDQADVKVETKDTVKAGLINVGGKLFSIPSPIQTALLIQKTGIQFNKNFLFPNNKVNQFNTDASRALMLGVYGSDLGYISAYNQTQEALVYLASIKQLADKLGISSVFDEKIIKRFENNLSNKDSLVVLVGLTYRASDSYLKDNKRLDINSLILLGGWTEGMNIAVESYKSKPTEELKKRILEQKLAVNNLLQLLSESASGQTNILNELKELKALYDKVNFEYKYIEPTTDTTKKITYINSTNELKVDDATFKSIIEKIQSFRNTICNPTL